MDFTVNTANSQIQLALSVTNRNIWARFDQALKMKVNVMMKVISIAILVSSLVGMGTAVAHEEKPDNSWWWSDAWWNEGKIATPKNYDITSKWISYHSGDTEVPAMVIRPKQKGKFPAVLFQHGRRGLDDLVPKPVNSRQFAETVLRYVGRTEC